MDNQNEKIKQFGELLEAKIAGLKAKLLKTQKKYKTALQSEHDYYEREIAILNSLIVEAYETKSQYFKMFDV